MTNSITIYIDEEFVEISYRINEIKRLSEVYVDFSELRDIEPTTLHQIETLLFIATAHD